MKRFALAALLLLWTLPLQAVEPHEVLDDPVLEARARDLSSIIRCVVCQNQSIDESEADLAAEMRLIVRERLVAGESDQSVLDYLVARYGDFVLLKPAFKPETYLLYYGPIIFLVLALASAALYFRRRQTAETGTGETRLTSKEQARLDRILGNDGDRE